MSPKSKILVDLRVALVQLNPQIGKLDSNISRANSLLQKFRDELKQTPNNRNPDLIVFPEFALTGYNFHSREHILPFSSLAHRGPSFNFACNVSKMFHCYTVIGYPEKETENADKLYNSAIVISPSGELLFNYRKSFLYYTDDAWGCQENPQQFQNFPMTFKQRGRMSESNEPLDVTLHASIGICMDLSPYKFEAPFNEFEFATYNLNNKTELIICPMAWLHSSSVSNQDIENDTESELNTKLESIKHRLVDQGLPAFGSQSQFQIDLSNDNKTARISKESYKVNHEYTELDKPDTSNINYWILRFLPFLQLNIRKQWFEEKTLWDFFEITKNKSYMGVSMNNYWEFSGSNAVLLCTNRCGVEDNNTVFAGSSGIYKFNGRDDFDVDELSRDDNKRLDSTNPSVELLGNLGKGHEGIIMRDIQFNIDR